MGRVAKTFTRAAVESAIERLNAIPEKPAMDNVITSRETLLSLKPSIKLLQQKGYSLDEILKELHVSGIDVGMTTLKTAVAKPKTKEKSPKTRIIEPSKPATTGAKSAKAFQDPDEK